MNKSERDKLAIIVSQMMYSFSTTSQVADAGKSILKKFPCIEEDVRDYRYVIAVKNVAEVLTSIIWNKWEPHLSRTDMRELRNSTFENAIEIFDCYMDSLKDPDSYIFELEKRIVEADEHEEWIVVADLIHSYSWRAAVADVYCVGSPVYNYRTCNM